MEGKWKVNNWIEMRIEMRINGMWVDGLVGRWIGSLVDSRQVDK